MPRRQLDASRRRRIRRLAFQQLAHGPTQSEQGTGLGLALTRRLVEAQGGEVGVRIVPGRGSVFHAMLPRRFTGITREAVSIRPRTQPDPSGRERDPNHHGER